jgi:hypothetical protein
MNIERMESTKAVDLGATACVEFTPLWKGTTKAKRPAHDIVQHGCEETKISYDLAKAEYCDHHDS